MHQIDHLNLEQKWAQINDVSRGKYSVNDQIKFKTTMLRSSLCCYSDEYILLLEQELMLQQEKQMKEIKE